MDVEECASKIETFENIIVKPEPMEEFLEAEDPLELEGRDVFNAMERKGVSNEFSKSEENANQTRKSLLSKKIIYAPSNEHIINGLEMDVTSEPNVVQAPFSLENYFHSDESSVKKNVQQVQQEFQNSNKEAVNHTCYDCNLVFDTEQEMEAHVKEHTDKRFHNFRKMGCKFCNENLNVQEKLQLHMMTLSGQSIFFCDRCRKSCAAVVRVKAQPKPSNKSYICHDCEPEMSKVRKKMVLAKKPCNEHVCNKCSAAFQTAALLESHKQLHINTCKACPDEPIHHLRGRFPCDSCKMRFSTLEEKNIHQQKEHVNTLECTKQLENPKKLPERTKKLQEHRRKSMRTSNNSLKASIPQSTSLEPRAKLNTIKNLKSKNGRECNSPRDYKCRYCDVAYTTSFTLNRHLKEKHNKEKPKYICKLCRKDFSLQKCYDNHITFHQIAKNYTCNLCNLAFLSKFELEQHMIWLHGKGMGKIKDKSDEGEASKSRVRDKSVSETNNGFNS